MTERFDRFNDTSEPSDYDANIPAVADAARAMLAALELITSPRYATWATNEGPAAERVRAAIAAAKAAGL